MSLIVFSSWLRRVALFTPDSRTCLLRPYRFLMSLSLKAPFLTSLLRSSGNYFNSNSRKSTASSRGGSSSGQSRNSSSGSSRDGLGHLHKRGAIASIVKRGRIVGEISGGVRLFSSKPGGKSENRDQDSGGGGGGGGGGSNGINNETAVEDSLNKVYTIPNMITLSRILLCPVLYYAINEDMKMLALGGVVYCAFTDWLDGFIAKRYNMSSRFGAFLDPLADKIFIAAMSIGLANQEIIPYPLVYLIILRDVILFSGTFYLRLKTMPQGAPIFDTTSTATFEIIPSTLSKMNTLCQFSCIVLGISNFTLGYPLADQMEPLFWLTAATTLGSGISYMDGSGMANNSRSYSDKKTLFNFFGEVPKK